MNPSAPSFLAPDALARRLAELVADERGALVDFLLHLEEFDRRRAWAEAGYDSLWTYCQRVLHLREGPAARRIGAMRVLRRFPRLADPLRDGRLCLSTVTLLTPLLSEETLDEVVARVAYRTKAEVERLVASLMPRDAPRDGIRRLPEQRASGEGATSAAIVERTAPALDTTPLTDDVPATGALPVERGPSPTADATLAVALADLRPPAARPTVTPVAADSYSLRVTLDAALKADLDELRTLLSHKIPTGDLAAVLREAVHCALEKHGRRKGARAPARERAHAGEATPAPGAGMVGAPDSPSAKREPTDAGSPRAARSRPHIPLGVRREVWKRDGGQCTWHGPDGHRCASRWQLELDHVVPFALGGGSTAQGSACAAALTISSTRSRSSAPNTWGASAAAMVLIG